ncbi:MAG: hypothetical protein ACUVXI_15175 [bacterium]
MSKAESYRVPYRGDCAPKLGVVTNSIGAFNERGKQHGESQIKALFEHFKKEGVIHDTSIFYDRRIFGFHEAKEVARLFGKEQVDAILIFNSAFPNGNVLPVIAMDRYLRQVPVIVAADVEPNEAIGSAEWVTNAVCGNDMNLHDATYIGRYVRYLAGSPQSEEFQNELKMLLNVYHVVSHLRHDYLGRFGDAPGGFHSATGDQLLYLKAFGTVVETVDLLRVKEVFDTMRTTGVKGDASFTEEQVQQTVAEMVEGRVNLIRDRRMLYNGARLYHALKAIAQAEGFTSAAIRCWPELQDRYVGITPCLAMGWALSKGDVTAFACEADWPGAVAQSIGTLLSGKPAAYLDFVNWTSASEVVQCGHCGVGIACVMQPNDPPLMKRIRREGGVSPELERQILSGEVSVTDALAPHGVARQTGREIGPTHIGQFQYGPKTGIDMIGTMDGKLKMLVFTGESDAKTAKGILYSAADVRVKNYKRLDQLKQQHGFSHHLSVAMEDISQELRELCAYYGIEYISPDD